MGKKKEKAAKEKDRRRNPPVETALDFRARERSAEEQTRAEDVHAPDGVSGSWGEFLVCSF